jgi:hypothetical protein
MSEVLQLTLWDWLDEAQYVVDQVPELVTVQAGLAALDSALSELADAPIATQLALAAVACEQLSELFERKAQRWFEDWERADSPGIVLSEDWVVDLVRSTPARFDLSPLVEPAPVPQPRGRKPATAAADSSLAGVVEPAKLLAMLEQLQRDESSSQPPALNQLLDLAGNESPTAWGNALAEALNSLDTSSPIRLNHLQQLTGLSPIELWLGLLLNGYSLSPTDAAHAASPEAFYQGLDALHLNLEDSGVNNC